MLPPRCCCLRSGRLPVALVCSSRPPSTSTPPNVLAPSPHTRRRTGWRRGSLSPTATRGTHARLDTIAARLRSGLVSFSVLCVTDTLPHFRMFPCSANHSFLSPASLFVPYLGFPSFCMHPAHPPLLLQPRFRRHGILLTQETPSMVSREITARTFKNFRAALHS